MDRHARSLGFLSTCLLWTGLAMAAGPSDSGASTTRPRDDRLARSLGQTPLGGDSKTLNDRVSAVGVLSREGSPSARASLERILWTEPEPPVRAAALEGLLRSRSPGSRMVLVRILSRPEPALLQVRALRALRQIEGPTVCHATICAHLRTLSAGAFVDAIDNAPTAEQRTELVIRAVELGKESLVERRVQEILDSPDATAKEDLVDAFLDRLNTERHPVYSLLAVRTFHAARSRKALPLLVHLLKRSDEPSFKAAIAQALGDIGDPLAVHALGSLLAHPPTRVRPSRGVITSDGPWGLDPAIEAARALAKIGAPEGIPLLRRVLDDPDSSLAAAAREAIEVLRIGTRRPVAKSPAPRGRSGPE